MGNSSNDKQTLVAKIVFFAMLGLVVVLPIVYIVLASISGVKSEGYMQTVSMGVLVTCLIALLYIIAALVFNFINKIKTKNNQ